MPHAVQVPGIEVRTCWDFVSLYKTLLSGHTFKHLMFTIQAVTKVITHNTFAIQPFAKIIAKQENTNAITHDNFEIFFISIRYKNYMRLLDTHEVSNFNSICPTALRCKQERQ